MTNENQLLPIDDPDKVNPLDQLFEHRISVKMIRNRIPKRN